MPLAAMWRPPTARRALRGVVTALLVGALVFDFNYYFHRVYTHQQIRWTLGERIVEMARIVRNQGDGWTGYILSPNFDDRHESVRLLERMWDIDIRGTPSLGFVLSEASIPERGVVFLSVPRPRRAFDILGRFLIGTATLTPPDPEPLTWWWGASWPYEPAQQLSSPTITAMMVPSQVLADFRDSAPPLPVTVSCRIHGKRIGHREPSPYYNSFSDTFPAPALCRWDANLEIPEPGPARLRVRSDPRLEILVDGKKHSPGTAIAAGLHEVSIAMHRPARKIRLDIDWRLPHHGTVPIPPGAWRSSKSSPEQADGRHPARPDLVKGR